MFCLVKNLLVSLIHFGSKVEDNLGDENSKGSHEYSVMKKHQDIAAIKLVTNISVLVRLFTY